MTSSLVFILLCFREKQNITKIFILESGSHLTGLEMHFFSDNSLFIFTHLPYSLKNSRRHNMHTGICYGIKNLLPIIHLFQKRCSTFGFFLAQWCAWNTTWERHSIDNCPITKAPQILVQYQTLDVGHRIFKKKFTIATLHCSDNYSVHRLCFFPSVKATNGPDL